MKGFQISLRDFRTINTSLSDPSCLPIAFVIWRVYRIDAGGSSYENRQPMRWFGRRYLPSPYAAQIDLGLVEPAHRWLISEPLEETYE